MFHTAWNVSLEVFLASEALPTVGTEDHGAVDWSSKERRSNSFV